MAVGKHYNTMIVAACVAIVIEHSTFMKYFKCTCTIGVCKDIQEGLSVISAI